jgi:hypothetical protein
MFIAGGGDIGIGTTSPTQKLDVNGNVAVSGSLYVDQGTTYGKNILYSSGTYYPVFRQYKWAGLGANYYAGGIESDGDVIGRGALKIGVSTGYAAIGSETMVYPLSMDGGGNVAIAKTTAANAKLDVGGNTIITGSLTVTGSIAVTGKLSVTDTLDSTDVFGLKTFTKSLTLTTSWIDTGISGTDLSTGTYIIQVYVDNYDVSGGQYTEYYSGTMSWFASTTNSTDYDEIVLHKAGHAPNSNWINLRTLRQVNPGTLKLQIISSVATTGADNYIFKFRRMI